MATDERQRILDWCGADSDARFLEEASDPNADFALILESDGTQLTATLPSGADRIVMRQTVTLGEGAATTGGDLAAALAELEERRPGPVTAALDPTGEQVAVGTWIFLDGLTKHSFLTAVSDLNRTRRAVLRLGGAAETAPVEATAVEPAAEEAEAAAPAADIYGAPVYTEREEEPAATTPSAWAWSPVTPETPESPAVEEAATPTASVWSTEPEAVAAPVEEAATPLAGGWPSPATPEYAAEEGGSEAAAETPAAEVPIEEPAPATTAAVEEEPVATPSPWETPSPAFEQPLATPAQAYQPSTSPVESYQSSATPAEGYQPSTSPAESYQPSATPAGYGTTPTPVSPMGAFPAGGAAQGYDQAYGQPATPAPVPSGPPPWTPSHRVPPQGMQAWAAPDPAGAVIATLGGHLPVQITEVRGAWAHVLCSNGWTGWVDNRLLIAGA